MRHSWVVHAVISGLLVGLAMLRVRPVLAQSNTAELRLRVVSSSATRHSPLRAVAWLQPRNGTPALSFVPTGPYVLLQKNRTFTPHLQVVPVGASVQFPNADPFFHNVFSLFDGKRFDLGLYEAGSSKSVTFTREGVSYIFCNIHPEMSAVIISLSTPLYGIGDAAGTIEMRRIPPGGYTLRLWVEGVPHSALVNLEREVHLQTGTTDLHDVKVPVGSGPLTHANKFGAPYSKTPEEPY